MSKYFVKKQLYGIVYTIYNIHYRKHHLDQTQQKEVFVPNLGNISSNVRLGQKEKKKNYSIGQNMVSQLNFILVITLIEVFFYLKANLGNLYSIHFPRKLLDF